MHGACKRICAVHVECVYRVCRDIMHRACRESILKMCGESMQAEHTQSMQEVMQGACGKSSLEQAERACTKDIRGHAQECSDRACAQCAGITHLACKRPCIKHVRRAYTKHGLCGGSAHGACGESTHGVCLGRAGKCAWHLQKKCVSIRVCMKCAETMSVQQEHTWSVQMERAWNR